MPNPSKTPLPIRADHAIFAQSASLAKGWTPLTSPLQGVPFQSPVANVRTAACPLRPSRTP